VSHLRDGASWIAPGGMYWYRSLAVLAVSASETRRVCPRPPLTTPGDGRRDPWRANSERNRERLQG